MESFTVDSFHLKNVLIGVFTTDPAGVDAGVVGRCLCQIVFSKVSVLVISPSASERAGDRCALQK